MDKENRAPEQTMETQTAQADTPLQDKTKAPATDFRSEILRELAERVSNAEPQQVATKTPVSQTKKKKQFKFGGPSLGQWADTRKNRAEKYATPVKTRNTPRSSSVKRSATRPRTATRTRPDTPASRQPRRSISQPRSVQRDVKSSTRPNRTPTPARTAKKAKTPSTKKYVATSKIAESPGLSKNVTVRSKRVRKRSTSQPRLRKPVAKKVENTKEKCKTITRTKRMKPGRVSRSEHKETTTKSRGVSAPRASSAKKASQPSTVTKPRATLRSLKKTKSVKTVTSRSSSARTKRTRKRNFKSVEPVETSNPVQRKRKRSQSAERSKPTPPSQNHAVAQDKPKRKVVRARRWSHVQPKVDTGLRKPTYVLKEVSTDKPEGMMTRSRKRKLSTLMEENVEPKDKTTAKRRRLN